MQTNATAPYYLAPGWFTRRAFNPAVRGLARIGLGPWGARELRVVGRSSGEWRSTPVNPLILEGKRYLVAARGETQWVRNLRVAGGGELRVGRKRTTFRAIELADADKVEVLRAYLRKWKWEVGTFFDGLGPEDDDATILAAARKHPVFLAVNAEDLRA